MNRITETDMWLCDHVIAITDKDGMTIPACEKSGLPCDQVLRYGDEDCELPGEETTP
jgi:hypothetical protein